MKYVKLFEQFITESHFSVGDKVRCLKSGMTGEVISLDDPAETPDAKYYNVKREDGEMMKYAPDELELAESTNEAVDTKYWADYNTDTSGQGKKEFANKEKDFEKTWKLAVSDWNAEAESDSKLKSSQEPKIKKLAQEFFKKEGWISVNVAQAMISQESY
jgi:hypothetical protein